MKNNSGIYIPVGTAYRMHSQNKITNYDLMAKVIAQDICNITLKSNSFHGNPHDFNILQEIHKQLSDTELDTERTSFLVLAYNFGYMRGIRKERKSRKRTKKTSN